MHISKKVFVSSILATGLLCGAVGVYASNGVSLVQAYLNSNIKFTVNGSSWTPKDANGNTISPLVYNGSTYLPAKAVGEAMNAEVLWNGSSKTVAITTGGATAGEPYNDASPTTTTSTTTTPTATAAPTAPTAPTSSVPASQPNSLPSGVLSLPANHDLSASSEKYKPVALAFIQAYGNALTSGSNSGINALVDKYVIDDLNDYDMGYKKRTKDNIAKTIAGEVKLNDSTIITKYAGILKSATLNDVRVDSTWTEKYENSTTLCYKIDLPGFFISSFSIFLEFEVDKKTNTYFLKAVNM
ncbi:stalk domain-containing protein [Paenibacillus sp. HW567]|uniref:stalk domain-containing protein n=1 Tax=Paenibacillus sp. HW567 TaxID=1034769 RepID=UPI00037E9851|nr:stalk domain-containing protein [Paenibacillus sp. HW567]